MRWLIILLLLTATVSAITISDYPEFFLNGDRTFTAIYVVGEEAPALDVVSATTISTALAQYENVTTAIGTARVDTEIADITQKNAIVIGSPCENTAAAALEGNPSPCYANLGGSAGYIKLFENNGKVQLLITGLTEEDRHAAAKFIAEKSLGHIAKREYIIPSYTGSTPPFFEQKNQTIAETEVEEEEDTGPVEREEVEEVVEDVPDVKAEPVVSHEYVPLEHVPEKEQGFFGRIWAWFKSLFGG